MNEETRLILRALQRLLLDNFTPKHEKILGEIKEALAPQSMEHGYEGDLAEKPLEITTNEVVEMLDDYQKDKAVTHKSETKSEELE